MAEPQVFEFILRDDGAPGPAPTPGAAAREKLAPAGQPDSRPLPREGADRQPGRTSRGEQAEPVLRPLLDAIQKATRYSTTAAMAAAGAGLLGPLLDIGRLIDDLRSGRKDEKPKPGAAAGTGSPATSPQPGQIQNLSISQAVINAAGAKILISGGDVVVQGGRPSGGGPAGPRGQSGSGYGVPALRTPTTPARTYDIDQVRDRSYARMGGAAARTALPATTGTAVSSASAGAAGGVSALGAASAAAVPALAAIVVTAGAVALSLRALYRRSTDQAKALASYEATLAAAQSRAQVASLRQDIRSAKFLGNDLAELTKAQSDFSIALQQRLDKIERLLLPIATKGLDLLTAGLEGVNKVEDVITLLKELATLETNILGAADRLKEMSAKRERQRSNEFMDKGDFYGLFESYEDLDIDDKRFSHNVNADRMSQNAPGLGPLPLP